MSINKSITIALLLGVCVSLAFTRTALGQVTDSKSFLDVVVKIADLKDLRDQAQISDILGVEFGEFQIGHQIGLRVKDLPAWLSTIIYSRGDGAPEAMRELIDLGPGNWICVTPEDVISVFGKNYTREKYMTAPSFADSESAARYLDEIQHGPGVIGLDYRLPQRPNSVLAFGFELRKCLKDVARIDNATRLP